VTRRILAIERIHLVVDDLDCRELLGWFNRALGHNVVEEPKLKKPSPCGNGFLNWLPGPATTEADIRW